MPIIRENKPNIDKEYNIYKLPYANRYYSQISSKNYNKVITIQPNTIENKKSIIDNKISEKNSSISKFKSICLSIIPRLLSIININY